MNMLEEYSKLCGFSVKELKGPSRKRDIVDARNIYCYIRRMMGASFEKIGWEINRNHTTALHSSRKTLTMMSIRDPATLKLFEEVKKWPIVRISIKVEEARKALDEAIQEYKEELSK